MKQNEIKEIWNKKHKFYDNINKIIYDDWLEIFIDAINKAKLPIIDLGCGSGNNSLWLKEQKKEIIACDFAEQAIEIVKKYIPNIQTKLFDMTNGIPFSNESTDLIIADLCLHYFDEKTTLYILEEIKRTLKKNGSLLFRVNSVNDIEHGAMSGEKIEHHFFFTQDMPKRFFDRSDLEYFFKDWKIEFLKEETMTRYEKPKILWKCHVSKT